MVVPVQTNMVSAFYLMEMPMGQTLALPYGMMPISATKQVTMPHTRHPNPCTSEWNNTGKILLQNSHHFQ